MTSTQIELAQIREIFSFQHVLQVAVRAPTDPIMFLSVRFASFKDDREIHKMHTSLRITEKMIFKADDVPDLNPFSRGRQMVGMWRFTAGIAIYKADVLKHSSPNVLPDFLASMRYQGLTTFEVKIVRDDTVDLNPDGTLRTVVSQDNEVIVSMNDI
jgi:hypothetical protein